MLLTAYPQFLESGWFDYDSYLWAAELWYSYAFEVSRQSCLASVPVRQALKAPHSTPPSADGRG